MANNGRFQSTFDVNRAIDLYRSGQSMAQVATTLGVSKGAISYAFKRNGVEITTRQPTKLKASCDDILRLIKDGNTISNIANQYGISTHIVYRKIRGLNRVRPEKITELVPVSTINTQHVLTEQDFAIISGILLGDASISKPNKRSKPHLEYGHAADQVDYVRLVHSLLKPLCGNRSIVVKAPSANINEDTFYRFRTNQHQVFDQLRKSLYSTGIKRIQPILEYLTPLSIALWYMDDGYFNNWNDRTQYGFCTDAFHIDDIKLLQSLLYDKFNINTYLESKNKNLVSGHKIIIHDHSIDTFESLIIPHIIQCMRHKIGSIMVDAPWILDQSYKSEFDKIIETLPQPPKPRLPKFEPKYQHTATIKIGIDKINTEYSISDASRIDVAEFLSKHHYLGRPPHHAKYYFKLECNGVMVGAAAFSTLRAASMTNHLFKQTIDAKHGLEVARFACLDQCGRNTESWFMSKCIDGIRKIDKSIKLLITYSQPEIGHYGYVYQATNWIYVGDAAGGKVKYYLDGKATTRKRMKRLHPEGGRTLWKKIYGDRIEYRRLPPKHKYIYVIDKLLHKILDIPYIEYPKKQELLLDNITPLSM